MIHALDVARAENLFGPLDDEGRQRLIAVIDNPCEETWEAAHSLVITMRKGGMIGATLWQAVIWVDSTFPDTGPIADAAGNRLSGWDRIPDRDLLLRALRWAVSEETDG